MHHILRLAADAPRVQPGIFLQLFTGLESKGHGAMQVRTENTLGQDPSVVWFKTRTPIQIKVPHLYEKQRSKILFFVLVHKFFCIAGGNWKRKSKRTHGHLCDRNCTREEEEGAEQSALELWLGCRCAALHCVSDPRHRSLTPPVFPFLPAACCNASTVHDLV